MKLLYLLLSLVTLICPTIADTQSCKNDIGLCLAVRSLVNGTDHDFYVTLRGKISNGWAATGIGQQMSGSIFFITYPGKSDNTTTLSIRTTSAHDPPAVLTSSQTPKGLTVKVLSSSRNATYFTTSWVCYACDRWKNSLVDANSAHQGWLYAVGGPGQKFNSDDVKQGISQHMDNGFGIFNVDMQQASSTTPSAPSLDGNGNKGSSTTAGGDWIIKMHALLIGGSFLAIFPAGVLALRSNLRWAVKAHMFIQGTATLFCILGMVFGIVFSIRDPRFQNFNYVHQILGFIIVSWVVLQFSAGLVHHIIYKRTGKSTPIAPVHIWSGRILLPVAIINGGLGLLLAGNRLGMASYYVLGFLGLGSVFFLCFRWQSARKEERLAGMYPGNYQQNYNNNRGPGGVPLSQQPVGQDSHGGAPYGHQSQASQSDLWNARPPQYHEHI